MTDQDLVDTGPHPMVEGDRAALERRVMKVESNIAMLQVFVVVGFLVLVVAVFFLFKGGK